MWFPRLLCKLNLRLLTMTCQVDALDSASFSLCPVRKLERSPAWPGASPVQLSRQGAPSIHPSARSAPEHAGQLGASEVVVVTAAYS